MAEINEILVRGHIKYWTVWAINKNVNCFKQQLIFETNLIVAA